MICPSVSYIMITIEFFGVLLIIIVFMVWVEWEQKKKNEEEPIHKLLWTEGCIDICIDITVNLLD